MKERATLRRVAEEVGVSYQTVSKVLNRTARVRPETEQRILEAAARLGYQPDQAARSLRSGSTRRIGCSAPPGLPSRANPILDLFVQGMLPAAELRGFYLLGFPCESSQQPPHGERRVEPYRRLLESHQVDGFVLSGVEYDDPRIRYLMDQKAHLVAFGRSNPDWDFPFVDVDGAAGMSKIMEHLLEQGHRKFAALAWPENSRAGQDRMAGVQSALQTAGLVFSDVWLRRGDGTYAFGKQEMQRCLAQPAADYPTAVIAFNDAMALGAMHAIQEAGLRVGQHLAVTGFDDSPMSPYLSPPLTSVSLPAVEAGQRAINLLVDRIEARPGVETHQLLEPELIVRASSDTWRGLQVG